MIRFIVWVGVLGWYLFPLFWLTACSLYCAARGMPANPIPPIMMESPVGLLTGLLLTSFVYAIWCSVGTICGFGVEHMVISFWRVSHRLRHLYRLALKTGSVLLAQPAQKSP